LADSIKQLLGDRVTIVVKSGIICEGTLIDKDYGFLTLKDAVVRGSKYMTKMGFLLAKPNYIQHVHSRPIELAENRPV